MPTLNQIQCSIELGPNNIKLKEYGIKYTNSVVETFVAVPNMKVPFTVHLEQQKYLAPGLAAFVFVDGAYHANRNKMGLKTPGEGVDKSQTVADFRFRQKEEKQADGQFIGREWHFADLKIAKADKSAPVNPQYYKNVGTIEVVVLRTLSPDRQDSAVQSSEPERKKNSKPAAPVVAASAKKSAPVSTAGSFFGGMAGLFDGAGDERPVLEESTPLLAHDTAAVMCEVPSISNFDGANDEQPSHPVNTRGGGPTNAQPPSGHIYDPIIGKFISLEEAVGKGDVSAEHQQLRIMAAMEYINAENAAGRIVPDLERLINMVTATMNLPPPTPVMLPDVLEGADPNAKLPSGYIVDPLSGQCISLVAAMETDGLDLKQQIARQKAASDHLDELQAAGIPIPPAMLPALIAASERAEKVRAELLKRHRGADNGKANAEHAQVDGAGQRVTMNDAYDRAPCANYPAGQVTNANAYNNTNQYTSGQRYYDADYEQASNGGVLPRLTYLPTAFTLEGGPDGLVVLAPYQIWDSLEHTKNHIDHLEQRCADIRTRKILTDIPFPKAQDEYGRCWDQAKLARALVPKLEEILYRLEEYMAANGMTRDQLPRVRPPGVRQIGQGVVRGPRRVRSAVNNFSPRLNAIPEGDYDAQDEYNNATPAQKATSGGWRSPDAQGNDWNPPTGKDRQSVQNKGWKTSNAASQRSNNTQANAWGNQGSGSKGGDDNGGWVGSGGDEKTKGAGGWSNHDGDKKAKPGDAWGTTSNKHRSSKPHDSSKPKVQISQSDGLVASSPPFGQPKAYWESWQKAPPASENSSSGIVVKRPVARDPYQYAAAKMPAVPENKVSKDVKYGVQAGKGVKYSHELARPAYIDSMDSPFAVFSFKYRSIDVLKKLVKDDVVADMKKLTTKVEEATLRTLPRDELIARMMKMKVSGDSKLDSRPAQASSASKDASAAKSEKSLHRADGWSEASRGKSAKGDGWQNQTSNKSAQDAWAKTQRSASNKGGDGGWGQQSGKSKTAGAQGWKDDAQNNHNGWDTSPATGGGWDGNNEQPADAVKPPAIARDYGDKTSDEAIGLTQMQDGEWVRHSEALRRLNKRDKDERIAREKNGKMTQYGTEKEEHGWKKVGDSLVSHAFNGNPEFLTRGQQGKDAPVVTGPYQFKPESNPMAKWEKGEVPDGPAGW